ncbi:MAG: hypothetical protein KGQ42_11365, partial [Alphaproteobacteria bacterium]|nr:hypothetical protein [Alphaproteobacteria bacterium]
MNDRPISSLSRAYGREHMLALLASTCLATAAHAGGVLPVGGRVAAGSATISGSADTLTVNQASSRAVIDWS